VVSHKRHLERNVLRSKRDLEVRHLVFRS